MLIQTYCGVSHACACTSLCAARSPSSLIERACLQGCFGLYHLALVRGPEPRCAYLAAARLRPAHLIGKATGARPAHLRRRLGGGRPPLLLMR